MSVNVVKILEGLCEASDDVVYSELRGCGDDEKNSHIKFNLEWDESVKTFQGMADEIAELRDMLSECRGALSACSIQESRNDGTENRMKIKALDKLVESVDLTLAKHK